MQVSFAIQVTVEYCMIIFYFSELLHLHGSSKVTLHIIFWWWPLPKQNQYN